MAVRKAKSPTAPTLAARFVQAPLRADPAAARAKVDDWLRPLGRSAAGKALTRLFSAHPTARALVEGVADGSPFLWGLAEREPERLVRLLDSCPDARFEALLAETAAQAAAAVDEGAISALLRRAKAETALLVALADIGGVWPVSQVTRALTRFADAAISCALGFLLRRAAEAGKFTPADPADPEKGCGYVVL